MIRSYLRKVDVLASVAVYVLALAPYVLMLLARLQKYGLDDGTILFLLLISVMVVLTILIHPVVKTTR